MHSIATHQSKNDEKYDDQNKNGTKKPETLFEWNKNITIRVYSRWPLSIGNVYNDLGGIDA